MTTQTVTKDLQGKTLAELHSLYFEAFKNNDFEETSRIFEHVRENFSK
jgi:hypothetical protein